MRRQDMAHNTKYSNNFTFNNCYLIFYNLLQTFGWSFIMFLIFIHCFLSRTYIGLFDQIQFLLNIFQTLAVLEVFHAIIGLVKSNPILTAFQIASRVFLVWGITYLIHQTHDQIGVLFFSIAWSITEIIRYSYYTASLLHHVPDLLQYLRYTLFIGLYPLGVIGEMLTMYVALPYIKSEKILNIPLPNKCNISFDYYYVLIAIMLVYIPGFPQLYMHMFAQRKKVLGDTIKRD